MALIAIRRVARIDLVSSDPESLARFYRETLDFVGSAARPKADEASRISLALDQQEIALIRPTRIGSPYPAHVPGWSCAFQHFAIVVSDMKQAVARFDGRSDWSPISTGGPQSLPASSGGVVAFKFRDPEGHPLELLEFPKESAPLPWRAREGRLFLGVDHSAISVQDTQRSVEYYGGLGFVPKGGGLNRGAEQERLDGIPGARVEVSELALGAAPPHLELLRYQGSYPRGAAQLRLCDVAATRLVLVAEEPLDPQRDPDGHWLVFEASPGAAADSNGD